VSRPRNIPQSVHDRLLRLARAQGQELNLLLTRYALERLLYRLSVSSYRDNFVLKGAMLFQLWTAQPHRATRDLDLLGYGENSTERVQAIFRDLCVSAVEDDGLRFDSGSIRCTVLKPDEAYEGVRVRLHALLGAIPIAVQVDIGFGDVVTPAPQETEYPTLLGMPAPRLRAYPRETVVAEKLEALVKLGLANSRLKDFSDLWMLSRLFAFEGAVLARAVRATFDRRWTPIPEGVPLALSPEFAALPAKRAQWQGFLRRGRLLETPPELVTVIEQLRRFLLPVLRAAASGEDLAAAWPPGGPWTASNRDNDALKRGETGEQV
jgi:hypothetical protein